jgi:hypothetical protein
MDSYAAINFFGLLEKTILTPEGYIKLSTVTWGPLEKFLAFSSDILSIMPFMLSLFVLKIIFKNYEKGEYLVRLMPFFTKSLLGYFYWMHLL